MSAAIRRPSLRSADGRRPRLGNPPVEPRPPWFSLAMIGSDYAMTIALLAGAVGVWRVAAVLHAFLEAGRARTTSKLDRGFWPCFSSPWSRPMASSPRTPGRCPISTPDRVQRLHRQRLAGHSGRCLGGSLDRCLAANGTPILTMSSRRDARSAGHRVTILLTGADFEIGRDHSLNDSLLVVSLDTDSNEVAMVSVPRDTSDYPLYWAAPPG